MKIAYDVSILGQGYINPKAKTGIFRVVESLLLELIKKPNISLDAISLNKYSSILDNISANIYFQSSNYLEKYFRSYYQSKLNLYDFYETIIKLQRYLIHKYVDRQISVYKFARALQIIIPKISQWDIRLLLKQEKYDIYHSCYYALPSSGILDKTSRLLTIHDSIPILFPRFFTQKDHDRYINTLNSIDRAKDWITCISQHSKNDFCEYTGMNPERVFVTPLAAANHFYPVKDRQLINSTINKYNIPDVPYILSLCTLEPRKNLSFLIQCFSEIIADNTGLELNLVLVGVNGWKNNEIFKAAQKNPDLNKRIIFTGYVPDEDLSAIYSGATAFVYPSLYEGFGLPPLEAMQCGTPVITSNTSSLPEVVGDAGIMIDPKQEDELCHALLKVINDSQLRTTLSQKGIERAKQFSWSKCAEQTVKVYQIAANKQLLY